MTDFLGWRKKNPFVSPFLPVDASSAHNSRGRGGGGRGKNISSQPKTRTEDPSVQFPISPNSKNTAEGGGIAEQKDANLNISTIMNHVVRESS